MFTGLLLVVIAVPIAHGQAPSTAVKKKAAEKKELNELVVNENLLANLPSDPIRPGRFHKVHKVELKAGVVYTIDLAGKTFDAFLRLEDAAGKQLAVDDDSGGNYNARIEFTPPRTEEYRIIATTFPPGQTGPYTLMVRRGRGFPSLPGPTLPGVIYAGGTTPPTVGMMGVGGVTVTLTCPPQNPSPFHGYFEYRLTLNNSAKEPHQVQVTMPEHAYGFGIHLRSLTRTIRVEPTSQAFASLFQPDLPMQGDVTRIVVDGQHAAQLGQVWPQRGRHVQGYSSPFSVQPTILVSANQSNNGVQFHWGRAGLPPFGPRLPSSSLVGPFQFASFAQPGGETCSKSWLGYSGYDGVVISSAELAEKGPEVQAALEEYVECGGSLVVVGPWKCPKTWERTRIARQGITWYYPGFGQCFNIEEPNVPKWSNEHMREVASSWQHSCEPWLVLHTPTDANKIFPVVENLTVPVRGMFVLMLVFSVLIGPVNLFVLARWKHRLWLLWTVPVISLITCLTVLGYMFAVEGWEGHLRTETFTMLDENEHRAVTLGWMGFYTPVVPSDGLHFSTQTELTPQLRMASFGMTSHPRTIDWTEEQHLASGWLSARVPAHFVVRKNERRLERVTVSKGKDGALTMMNGLKADIREIRFMAAHGGKVYAASNVPAGQQAVLKSAGAMGSPDVDVLRVLYRRDWLEGIRKAGERPESLLRAGCYVAVLDATPFLEDGLSRPGHRQGHAVVYGVMKEPIED
jgi:hypothetical protein